MAGLSVHVRHKEVLEALQKIRRRTVSDKAVQKLAIETAKDIVAAGKKMTPVRWTGNTRKKWNYRVNRKSVTVYNYTRAIGFLDQGTKAHGPVSAPMLFIPKNKKAARQKSAFLKRGRDYVLKARVRGVRALHISDKLSIAAQVVLDRRLRRMK